MSEVVIDSIEGRSLRLSHKHPPDEDEIWAYDATLSLESGTLTTTVWDSGVGLSQFLRHLADAWAGFDGDQEFTSLEGELSIVARQEGRGQVWLALTRAQLPPPEWNVTATLTVGAGAHLERIASDVATFSSSASA